MQLHPVMHDFAAAKAEAALLLSALKKERHTELLPGTDMNV
jgi:hypothetical protein